MSELGIFYPNVPSGREITTTNYTLSASSLNFPEDMQADMEKVIAGKGVVYVEFNDEEVPFADMGKIYANKVVEGLVFFTGYSDDGYGVVLVTSNNIISEIGIDGWVETDPDNPHWGELTNSIITESTHFYFTFITWE